MRPTMIFRWKIGNREVEKGGTRFRPKDKGWMSFHMFYPFPLLLPLTFGRKMSRSEHRNTPNFPQLPKYPESQNSFFAIYSYSTRNAHTKRKKEKKNPICSMHYYTTPKNKSNWHNHCKP